MADDAFEYVLAQLTVRSRRGDRAEALCPSHDDHSASLSVSRGNEQPVVLHCHAGCTADAVMAALGMTMADLSVLAPKRARSYYYTDPGGRVVYSVERWVPKKFMPRLPDGSYRRPAPADEVLYNLPNVLAAKERGERVFLVEGERDVDTLREHGYVGTTAMSGATQAWLPQFSEALANANVTIVADNDAAGRTRARRLTRELEPYVRAVRMVVPRYGKDVSDLLLAGFGIHVTDPLSASDDGLVMHSYQGLEAEPLSWAWEGWIPEGMFTIMEGDPGEGKSVLSLDLAARWTTGQPMPNGADNHYREPINVGVCSAEDDATRVILPRFLAAGGDPKRLFNIIGPIAIGTQARLLDLGLDLDKLRESIENAKLRVLLLDPLMAMLGTVRTNIDAEVRKVLTPLRYLAEETHCTIIAIRHLRKQGGKAVYAGGGSIGFTGAARSVIVVGRNPHDEAEHIMAIAKNNLGPLPTSQGFALISDLVAGIPAPRVKWTGDSPLLAADLAEQLSFGTEVRAEVTEEVVRLLGEQPMAFTDLRKRLLLAGIEHGEKMLRSVLKTAAVAEHRNLGTASHKVVYRLKSQAPIPPQPANPQLDASQDALPSTSPEKVDGTSEELPSTPDDAAMEVDGTRRSYGQVPSTAKDTEGGEVDGTQEVLPSTPQLPDELMIACTECSATEGIVYYEGHGWRCFTHNPLAGGPS